MKKGILLSTLASALLLGSLNASELTDRLEKLESQMKQLQVENKELKAAVSESSTEDMGLDIEDLDTRLSEIETRSYTDRIQFGIGFKTRVENFKRQMADGTSSTDSNIWSTKLMLNMRSEITDDMKFNGRLSMFKYWADSTKGDTLAQDSAQGRMPSDSTLYVERAYIDWTLNDGDNIPVTLTIGRQPSSDGPSYTYMDDTTRKSTYSALAFDGATDGLVATVNLSKATGIAGTAVRLAYGKGYQNDDNTASQNTFVGVSSNQAVDDTNIMGLFIDSSIPALPGSLLQLGYVKASDMVDFSNPPTGVTTTTIGDMSVGVALIEVPNVMKSGLDLFAQYAVSKAESNGQMGAMGGLLGATTAESKDGNALWLGARYELPIKNKPKIGLEYNKGSKNWFAFTWGAHDTYNKLATRGDAWEIYYIQPINRYSFLRAGMVAMDYEYTGSGSHLGTPTEITSASGGTVLDKLTNYYLQFNLLY
jgi:regulator of replication initiation timing